MSEEQTAETKAINEGVRNVDNIDFASREEVNKLTRDYEFLDSGMDAIVLKSKTEPEVVMRVEMYNPLGKEWTLNTLSELSSSVTNPITRESYDDALDILAGTSDGLYNKLAKMRSQQVNNRVAAHNTQYGIDPSSTIPINLTYSFQGQPFAVRMKYLEGVPVHPNDEQLILATKNDIDGNAHNRLTDIQNSPHKTQIIDIADIPKHSGTNLKTRWNRLFSGNKDK